MAVGESVAVALGVGVLVAVVVAVAVGVLDGVAVEVGVRVAVGVSVGPPGVFVGVGVVALARRANTPAPTGPSWNSLLQLSQEAARAIGLDGRQELVTGDVGVDLQLDAERLPERVEAPRENAQERPVL